MFEIGPLSSAPRAAKGGCAMYACLRAGVTRGLLSKAKLGERKLDYPSAFAFAQAPPLTRGGKGSIVSAVILSRTILRKMNIIYLKG